MVYFLTLKKQKLNTNFKLFKMHGKTTVISWMYYSSNKTY